MLTARTLVVALYADRSSRQWVARDPDGNLWHLPATPTPWEDRRPYSTVGAADLEPVPGHYAYLLGLSHPTQRDPR